jgi:eukaryotic-like serine/threonine-protein kinase
MGEGLLQLTGFSQKYPLTVEAKGCAVQTDALIAWKTDQPDISFDKQMLRWSGEGNLYDINGPSWVILWPKTTSAAALNVADLDNWSSQVASEQGSRRGAVQLLPNDGLLRHTASTPDSSVKSAGPGKAGADLDTVGPRGERFTPPRDGSRHGNPPA